MRYLVLIYANPENWEHPLFLRDPRFLALPPDERERLVRRFEELQREITESGELVEGTALAPPQAGRTVRWRDGVPAATDGPFPEAKEHLAGYLVLDVETAQRAEEIVGRIPEPGITAVELRPIVDT